jgi:hypothetical protein
LAEPELLYHYTDAGGLIGIVEDDVLWATDAEFLNDAQELRYGREEMREALLARAEELSAGGIPEGSAEGSRATAIRSAADHLEPGGTFAQRQYHSAYVACVCEDGDLLSQWRAYGGAGGYAIGFRSASLREMQPDAGELVPESVDRGAFEAAEPPPLTAGLVQVRYGSKAVESALATVLRDIAPEPVGHPGVAGFYQARSVVLPALAEIKHDAFEEEREWRHERVLVLRLHLEATVGEDLVHQPLLVGLPPAGTATPARIGGAWAAVPSLPPAFRVKPGTSRRTVQWSRCESALARCGAVRRSPDRAGPGAYWPRQVYRSRSDELR